MFRRKDGKTREDAPLPGPSPTIDPLDQLVERLAPILLTDSIRQLLARLKELEDLATQVVMLLKTSPDVPLHLSDEQLEKLSSMFSSTAAEARRARISIMESALSSEKIARAIAWMIRSRIEEKLNS